MPYMTTRTGWQGLGAGTQVTAAQYNAMTPAQKQAYATLAATGMNIMFGTVSGGGAATGSGIATASAPLIASGAIAPSQGFYAVAKDGGVLFNQASQSNPIKTTGDATTAKPSPFASLTDLFTQITGSSGADVLPTTPRAPVIAPNLLANTAPPKESGLPSWVLPVGIGVAVLGVVAFLVMRKRK